MGKALVDFICAKAKALGYREISLGVDKDNDTALHLYRAKGFDRVLYEGRTSTGRFISFLKRSEPSENPGAVHFDRPGFMLLVCRNDFKRYRVSSKKLCRMGIA